MTFDYCGLAVASNLDFPELPASLQPVPDLSFFLSTEGNPPGPGEPLHQWDLPGAPAWLSISRSKDGYLLHFPELATFHVAACDGGVQCWPHNSVPLDSVRHLFLDQVMPLVLSLAGRTVFHASAVSSGAGAIAFLGDSGRGKSTLAGIFVNQGAELLTDDCLLVDKDFRIVPSYPGLRLWPDAAEVLGRAASDLPRVCHYSSKKRLRDVLPSSCHPVPLRRLYLLAEAADAISIATLSPRDALIELVKFCFVLDIANPEALKARFETLSRLAGLGLVYRLSYPRDLEHLPDLHDAILRHASAS